MEMIPCNWHVINSKLSETVKRSNLIPKMADWQKMVCELYMKYNGMHYISCTI